MYETFFGLKRRPFAASPDADVLVECDTVADAIDRLDLCVRQGRGIGVLTAAAGMGKTHLCHRLARRWGTEFRVAMLPNGSFPTPRGLLQAILAELDQPYQRLGETELLLELTAAARAARTRSAGVVLLLDEAHRYSERLLDEVRLIANLVENGEPLVRIVLAGQVELEDKLASPGLAGLNERVGELVTLPRLTAQEARTYLEERAVYAGTRLEELFETEAIDVIVQACGGTPRCLNQLADHGLLLGYVAERRPVDENLVREALEDLKRLPLQWNDPQPAVTSTGPARISAGVVTISDGVVSGFGDNVIEIGNLSDGTCQSSPPVTVAENTTWHEESAPESETANPPVHPKTTVPMQPKNGTVTAAERTATEPVQDRFARIDAAEARRRWFEDLERAGTPVEVPIEAFEIQSFAPPSSQSGTACEIVETRPATNPLATLDRVEPMIAEALGDLPEQSDAIERHEATDRLDGPAELDQFVTDLERQTEAECESAAVEAPNRSQAGSNAGRNGLQTERFDRPLPGGRRSSTLFSDLRRRRRESRNGRS